MSNKPTPKPRYEAVFEPTRDVASLQESVSSLKRNFDLIAFTDMPDERKRINEEFERLKARLADIEHQIKLINDP